MIKTLIKSMAWVAVVFIIACVIISFNTPTCKEALPVQIPTYIWTSTEKIPITYEKMDAKISGMFKLPERRIIISNEIGREREIEVLWHESLHVLMSQIEVRKVFENQELNSYQKEEEIVRDITVKLIELLKNNKMPLW